jgi:hypothetical protein
MYGDPFLSLVVAALFAIVFYNHSSIPNGKSYDSQNMRDPRASEVETQVSNTYSFPRIETFRRRNKE